MVKQNIFVINNLPLYEILAEIKENLSFSVLQFENEDNFIKNSNLNKTNSLLISSNQNKLKLIQNITDKNLLSIDDLPLPLNKMLELIHIKLIKLRFNYQSKVKIKDYELNLNSKFFSKGDFNLKLTEKEIEIILYLHHSNTTHNISNMQKNIWSYSPNMETHTVETHIYRLRKKISDKFNDENFILSHKNGYFIDKVV